MTFDLSPVVAATATWLTRAYPAPGGTFSAILAERQARQAVGVAGLLRYPDPVDVELVLLLGPGGAGRLDWLAGTDPEPDSQPEHWRSWVDEVLASWAACLLGDAALAAAAVAVVARDPRRDGPPDFRRLTAPDACDRHAAALLRHPDLLAPVADLHRPALLELLDASRVEAG
ncbi:MAG TPA: hypothetical protein VJT31_35235 [Rugosimonospora sp.]|nr:hypothetical protein [Rugosimonospora sp.]